MKKLMLTMAAGVFFCSLSFSQENSCGTDYMNTRYGQLHPERLSYREQMLQAIQSASIEPGTGGERNTLVIPAVVHVMHKGGVENISTEQIEDAMRVLNEDLRRINSDTGNTRGIFKPYASDFNIELRLAKIDPSGNCTNGITRTFSPITYEADDNIKSTSTGGIDPWPVNKYFNIWVVGRIVLGQSGVIGYAYFPSWGMSNEYGVVMDNKYMGTIGTADGKDGRTLTHEVGHCLELYHTFQSGCGNNCSNSGDQICDTPPVSSATFGCAFALNSCSNDASGPSAYNTDVPDMIENYMSYNQNFCQNMFSKGQKNRSEAALTTTFISSLVTPANNASTGTTDGFIAQDCTLNPDFAWSKSAVCVGDSVQFYDLTMNGLPDSYTWQITGPQTINRTETSPLVTFTIPGLYSVNLSVTNANGTQSLLKTGIINVLDPNGTPTWMFLDNMELQPLGSGRWTAQNLAYGEGWEEKIITANGNHTLYINNIQNDFEDLKYEVYSPSYNLTEIADPKFRFKTAFASRFGSSSDNLKVYFSTDCGKNWILRFSKTGETLASMSPSPLPINPISGSDWTEWELDIPTIMENAANFRVKFVFETGFGNDLYLDDINIMGTSAIAEQMTDAQILISPNPASNFVNIDLRLLGAGQPVTIRICDMGGRTVYNTQTQSGSVFYADLTQHNVGSGMYTVFIESAAGAFTSKLIISKQ